MRTRSIALALIVAACAETAPPPETGPVVPVRIELGVTGQVAPIVDADGRGEITVTRDGSEGDLFQVKPNKRQQRRGA